MRLADFVGAGLGLVGSFLNQDDHLTPTHSRFLKWLEREQPFVSILYQDYQPALKFDVRALLFVSPSLSSQAQHVVGLRKGSGGFEIFGVQRNVPGDIRRMQAMPLQPPPVTLVGLDGEADPSKKEKKSATSFAPGISDDGMFEVCYVSVREPLAKSILRAWAKVLAQSRILPLQNKGLDGAGYLFSLKADGKASEGTIWSPREGSQPARLAEIGQTMWNLCINQNKTLLLQLDKQVLTFVKSG